MIHPFLHGPSQPPRTSRRECASPPAVARALRTKRRFQPAGNDRLAEIVDPAMLDGEAERWIMDHRARARRVCRHDNEASVDLLPPVHPRRILLADVAAL